MSLQDNEKNRLWVQVLPSRKAPLKTEAFAFPAAIVANVVASGIGAIVKTAADRLIATDQYLIKTLLAFEPAFVMRANETSASFLLTSITLNVGPEPIPTYDPTTQAALPFDTIVKSRQYEASPVVIRLELEQSQDRTAFAGRVTHWKYDTFLDQSSAPFRKERRKVTIEVKVSDVEAGVLLATAMQVEADGDTLSSSRPNAGERLPWVKRPVKNYPGERVLAMDQEFGPVNIEASITEIAEPSGFAKFLGGLLGNQKVALEQYFKDRVSQALDEGEAAKAKLASLAEATTARDEYEKAYHAAVEGKKAYAAAADAAAKTVAKQALDLKLAILHQKETLARAAFDRSGLPFVAMPAVG